MAIQTLNTIKNWFKTSLKPSQQQFWDTWDSFRHKLEKVPVKEVEGLDELLNTKADKTTLIEHLNDKNAHAAQVNTDWNSESGFSQLLNKPEFKTINGESVLGDGNIIIEESGLQNLDQTLANGNTSTKEIIFESNGGDTTTFNNMGVLLRGNNSTNSSLSSLGFYTVGTNGLAYVENSGQITVSHFGGSTLQIQNNEIRHNTINGNSSSLQFDNSEQGHFIQTIPSKTGTIALLSDIEQGGSQNLQDILQNGNETNLTALFTMGEDEDIYENKINAKQIEIKHSNANDSEKNKSVSLKSDLIDFVNLNTGETTALFAEGVGFGNSNLNTYSVLEMNPNTTANYSNVLLPAITEEGQTKTLATTDELSLQGIVNANITATKNLGNSSVDILKGEGESVSSRTTIRSAANYNIFSSHEIGKNYHNLINRSETKETSIEMDSGLLTINQTNSIDRSKITSLNFLPPTGINTISFPAPAGDNGSYILATTSDFKTINGESIVGEGNLEVAAAIPDGAIKVAGGLALDGTFRNLTDNLGNPTRLWINRTSITSVAGDNTLNNVAFGPSAMSAVSSGVYNTAFGSGTLMDNTSGTQNTAVGYSSLQNNTTGYSNTAVGWSSLGANIDGESNVAIGQAAMFLNKSGDNNIAVGKSALSGNTAGNNNIAIGYAALSSSQSSSNIAIGTRTLVFAVNGSNNLAIGEESLQFNVDGSYNTAIGLHTLKNITSGSWNVALGLYAGRYTSKNTDNTSSNNSIFLGSGAMPLDNGGSNEVVIGDFAVGSGTNSVTLGNNNITKTFLKGSVSAKSYKVEALNTAPTSSTDTGSLGEIRITANYIYVCTATNTWVRSALSAW